MVAPPYVSVIGSNALLHNPAETDADVMDLNEIARFNEAWVVAERRFAQM